MDIELVIAIVIPTIVSVTAIVIALRSGGGVSKSLVAELEKRQADREYMDRLEMVYSRADARVQRVVDVLADVVKYSSTYTNIPVIDEVSDFVEDVREAGKPGSDKPAA